MNDLKQTELADIVGVSEQQIYKHCKAGVITRNEDNTYPFSSLNQLFTFYRSRSDSGESKDVKAQQEAYKRDINKHEARIRKLKADRLARKLVEFDLVKEDLQETAQNIRDRLLGLPSSLAPLVLRCEREDDVKRIIRAQITDCLSGMVELRPEKYDGVKDVELETEEAGSDVE